MEVKKRLGEKTSGFLSNFISKIYQWHVGGNKKLYPRKSRSFCNENFHQSMYPALVVAQCFGVLPVLNISARCPLELRFTWRSFSFVYAVFVLLCSCLKTIATAAWSFQTSIKFGKLGYLVYYSTNFLLFVHFLHMAKAWPEIMRQWHKVEKKLQFISTEEDKQAMRLRIQGTATLVLTLCCIDHVVYMTGDVLRVLDCPVVRNVVEAYFIRCFPETFTFFKYTHALGLSVKLIQTTSDVVWCFADFFIIVLSCGLSGNLRVINNRLMLDKGKVRNFERWIAVNIRVKCSAFYQMNVFFNSR
jgi:gustatory receptor